MDKTEAMGAVMATRLVADEDLKVGDMVDVLGIKRIIAIHPYKGPLVDIIFAIAYTVPGSGFSLERGGQTYVVS